MARLARFEEPAGEALSEENVVANRAVERARVEGWEETAAAAARSQA